MRHKLNEETRTKITYGRLSSAVLCLEFEIINYFYQEYCYFIFVFKLIWV